MRVGAQVDISGGAFSEELMVVDEVVAADVVGLHLYVFYNLITDIGQDGYFN